MIAPAFHRVTLSVFLFSRRRVNRRTLSVLTVSATKAEISILRGEHGPAFQYMTLLDTRIVTKPVPTGVKYVPLVTPGGSPGVNDPTVGRACVGTAVGNRVGVSVGVNNSAPTKVTVGVNVRGVLVDMANRSCVGRAVFDGVGVAVSAGGGEVCVAPSCGRLISGRPEQAVRNNPRIKI